MLTKEQYLIIKKIYKHKTVSHEVLTSSEICSEPFRQLLTEKLIEGLSPVDICREILFTKYQITTDGIIAFEEYDRVHKSAIKSNVALFLSGGALLISILSAILQTVLK